MEIFKGTNKTETGTILLTKSISTLIIGSSKAFDELTTETIRVEVERANGSNFEITKGSMFLKDFILANTYGSDAIISDGARTLDLVAVCEICNNGSIHLFEKDVIKVELRGLIPAETYVINGIEEPETSTEIYSFEHKSMSAEDTNKDFNVEGYDVLVLDKSATIEEINYTFENGQVVKYSLFELESMSKSIDPVAYVKTDGTVKSAYSDKIQLPLYAVRNLNIRKAQGAVINLTLRNHL
ncbi:hypothetical protein B0A75_18140 [Flavobacterium oncorhynchi]|uniref:Uncharacterized protein n=1 Tax=Flavobacterium oncorhynchi TaxID=728056 RepID=A0A226HQS5_9FLAO|nr:hypothetical protein [Flavobacterium oncorhynchi]OXA95986.1 hypothetical protein B0A75_18140 [Flavobacterium oncorhynchi]